MYSYIVKISDTNIYNQRSSRHLRMLTKWKKIKT